MPKRALLIALGASLVLVCAAPARAQLYEDVGTRAQGMGGAFVGVSDDATATWWNPAGLAGGSVFNMVFEKGRLSQPDHRVGFEPARRAGDGSFALALPSLGASYYRLRVSQIAPTTSIETPRLIRQDLGGVRSLAFTQLGITIGQSLTDHFVVGTTLKLVRGGVASTVVDGSTDPMDVGDDLEIDGETHGDLDVGAMLTYPAFRLGVSVRNLRQPKFGEGKDRIVVKRQARAGMSIATNPKNAFGVLTLAADADLSTTPTLFGDVRHVATGAEGWLLNRRLGLRAGVTKNTVGARRSGSSTGVSISIAKGIFIDGAKMFGADDSIRGWSSTVRFAF